MTNANEAELREIKIYFPSFLGAEQITSLVNLVNDVYDVAERNMWKQKGVRTTLAEVEALIKKQRLMVAEVEGSIVGLIKIDQIDEETGEFGMLVVDPAVRGRKLGRLLVQSAEKWVRNEGCKTMQLELLTPRTWNHPTKEFLKGWYSRMGYVPQRTAPFGAEYPDIASLLACDCDFTIWTKNL